MLKKLALFSLPAAILFLLALAQQSSACGGFFCQNNPVNQAGERIVFTVNDDDTISSLIEIQYTGDAPDFSWILPIPEAITADDLAVPDGGADVFPELHSLTDVQVIPPPRPSCMDDFDFAMSASEDGSVDVFASGEVGPFGFDVIGSEDPDAVIDWLRENNYRVDASMEPLIAVYVEEQFAFVAMRLLDGETSESITPIEITYPGQKPMIPLRLTAVAATDNMPVWVWIFGDEQAVPENFAHMEVATEELTFNPFGGNDYPTLVMQRADALDGQAFITEFAGPSSSLGLSHPYLQNAASEQPYLTRLATYISPDEMTVDPVFGFDGDRSDVSNVRDATDLVGLYDCERDDAENAFFAFGESDAINPRAETGEVIAVTPANTETSQGLRNLTLVAIGLAGVAGIGYAGFRLGRR